VEASRQETTAGMLASGRCGQDARSGRSVGAMPEPKAPRAAWREDRPVAAEAAPPFTGISAKKYSAAGLLLSLFIKTHHHHNA